jgi:2-iminobutanoate/2-iminopropanoate deaminase
VNIIESAEAPAPVGPYSQAVAHGGVVYLSGQIALDPETGQLAGASIEEQTEQVVHNLATVLRAAGSGWDRVLKVTVYLVDLSDFARFNVVYQRALAGAEPARATVQVAGLPLGARLEIDAIALVTESRAS